MRNRSDLRYLYLIYAMTIAASFGPVIAQKNDKEIDLNSIKSKGVKELNLIPVEKRPSKEPAPNKPAGKPMSFDEAEGSVVGFTFEEIEGFSDELLSGVWQYSLIGKPRKSLIFLGQHDKGVTFPIKTPPIAGNVGLFRQENGAESVKESWERVREHSKGLDDSERLQTLTNYGTVHGIELKDLPAWKGKVVGSLNGEIVLVPVAADLVHGFWIVTVPITNQIMNFEMFTMERNRETEAASEERE